MHRYNGIAVFAGNVPMRCKGMVLLSLKVRSVVCGVAVGVCLSAYPVSSYAQKPRSRTLTFDASASRWVEQGLPVPGTPEADIHAIRKMIEQRKPRRALRAIKRFIRVHGESHPLHPEALISRAQALIDLRAYHKAHLTLQEFLSSYEGTSLTMDAQRLEFIIAEAYLGGAKRKLFGLRLLSGEETALQILDDLSVNNAESRLAELAAITKADYFFDRGEHALAELEYARLLRDQPNTRYHRFALRRTADAALASYGGTDYDEAAIVEADARYRDYGTRYPAEAAQEGVDEILDSIRESRAQKDFGIGRYYESTEHLGSAVYYYRFVSENWPNTIAATRAASRLDLLQVVPAPQG